MKFSHHVVTSTILSGAVYAVTGSTPMAVSTVASGILIDLDHVLDFLVFSNKKFTLKNMFVWCDKCQWEKVTLLLHSWEMMFFLACLAGITGNPVLLGIVIGAGFHLTGDQIVNPRKNPLHRYFYFLGFRIAKGFRREHILVESTRGSRNPTEDQPVNTRNCLSLKTDR